MALHQKSGGVLVAGDDGFIDQPVLGHIQRDALGVANAVAAQPAPQGLVHAAGDFVGHSDPQGVTTHQGNLPVKQPVALRPQSLLLRVAQVPHL